MIVFLLIVAVVIFFLVKGSIAKKKETMFAIEQMNTLPATINGFSPARLYSHPTAQSLIAIDPQKKMLLMAKRIGDNEFKLIKKKNPAASPIIHKIVTFDNIIKSEIIVDGQDVSKQVSSAAGALIGAAIGGTSGAIIGSRTGKTKHTKEVESVRLKVLLRDITDPSYELTFFQKGQIGPVPKVAQEECQRWHDTITVAIAN